MRRLDYIDGWRTISVLLVILSHVTSHSNIRTSGFIGDFFLPYGGLGVKIFFVISGFVICRSMITEHKTTGQVSLSGFFLRRIFRIIPPLLLFVLVIVGLSWGGILDDRATGVVRGLYFACNIPPPTSPYCGGTIGAHLWSLSFEEQFYIVFPFLFLGMVGRTRLLALFLAMLPFLAILLFFIKWTSAAHYVVPISFLGVGVILALYEKECFEIASRVPAPLFFACILVTFFIPHLSGTAFGTAVNALFLPPFIVIVLCVSANEGVSKTLLANPIMVRLGKASYGIYLWQQLATLHFEGAGYTFYLFSIAACIIGSVIMFEKIEKPIVRAADKRKAL